MRKLLLLLALAAASLPAAAQETLYITDRLQLGLFTTRDASGEPIRNLGSGTEVTVLERIPNFARVRTPAGEEGWVKSAFLVTEKPALLRVSEAETERAALEQQLAAAVLERDAAAANADIVVGEAATALAGARADQEALARLEQDNAALLALVDNYRGAVPWSWVAAGLLVALGAGFVGGYWWLDATIRRRHGGFRVH